MGYGGGVLGRGVSKDVLCISNGIFFKAVRGEGGG